MIDLDAHVAILIDADQTVSFKYLEEVLAISEYYGQLKICRAYGDWEGNNLKPHLEKLDVLKIDRIQVDNKGKNATDHHLLVEAGEILGNHEPFEDVSVFIIVSGDGDFTSACKLIQERGRKVVVISSQGSTAPSLKETCGTFYYLEDLNNELKKLRQLHPISPNEVRTFFKPLFHAYLQLTKNDSWVEYNQLGKKLREIIPDFENQFGKYRLSTWLKNYGEYFESQDQMVRRFDPNPERTSFERLISAYLRVKETDGSVSLAQFEDILNELGTKYGSRFVNKSLSEWLDSYSHVFEIDGDLIIEKSNWWIPSAIKPSQ